jgi:predicted transcriptional regulator of viral defense system
MKNLTYRLHKSSQTVFTAREIALMLGETDRNLVKSKINYYVKRDEITALRRGIYAKDDKYSEFELATKIYSPSYVSFDTVLGIEGVTFQYDSRIFVASYLSRQIKVGETGIFYKKLKEDILLNPQGIVYKNGVAWATLERAFMDRIYLNKKQYFDNLAPIDFEICGSLLPIYGGAITSDTLKSYANDK